VATLMKQLKWKKQFAVIWLKERFGVDTISALTQNQGANAYTLLASFGNPSLYERVHAEMLAAGEVLA
jgi:hypothetical protein